jgi:S-adenosylhomocysteine hydrolase
MMGGIIAQAAHAFEGCATPDFEAPTEVSMERSLAGKVALVAGATRGAGRGIAVQLGAAGATVYITGRTTRSQQSE